MRYLIFSVITSIFQKLSKIFCYLKGFLLFGKIVCVGKGVTILGIRNIQISERCKIGKGVLLDASTGKININNKVNIAHDAMIIANHAKITIGENCHIGEYTQIAAYLGCNVDIGRDTLLAPFNFIISSNHGFNKNDLIRNQQGYGKQIVIGNDVWIAAKCTVLPGAIIMDGSVIGANSLVSKKSKKMKNGIFVGNPVKLIAMRE